MEENNNNNNQNGEKDKSMKDVVQNLAV